ncbi:MAG: chitobiase/beta-hexosaminidase C-terminal domain-containing protein, partial [Christensenella sp.]
MKRKVIAAFLAVVISVTLVGGSVATAFAQNESMGGAPTATPAQAEPNAAEPNVAEPNVAEPNAAEPNAAAPNAAEPNAAEPNAAEPSAAAPNAAAPNALGARSYRIAGISVNGGAEMTVYDTSSLSAAWALTCGYATGGSTATMTLYSDWYPSSYIDVPSGTNIRINLNGYTVNRRAASASGSGMVFYVREGTKFEIADWSAGGNGKITGGYGSGYGGGIHILSDSEVTLSGGNIMGNKSTSGGGGVQLAGNDNTKFIMTGGSVSNNEAVDTYGGGVYIWDGMVRVRGGSISNNTATYGGGVYIRDTATRDYIFLISGGNIYGNHAQYDGGGVYVAKGTAAFTGGSVSDNDAQNNGGGVYVHSLELTYPAFLVRGADITNNTARQGNGGGLYMALAGVGLSRIVSGNIKNNYARKDGGGIYAANMSHVTLGDENGAGNNKPLVIDNNSPENLFLPSGSTLYTVDPLAANSKVGIYTADTPSGQEMDLTLLKIKETLPLARYFSDRSLFEVRAGVSGKLVLTKKEDGGSEVTKYNGQPLKKGIYSFTTTEGGSDKTANYYYTDGYFMEGPDFAGKATVYNSHLATMSYNLAMAAFGASTDYPQKYQYAENLLADIGFKDIKHNKAFTEKPTKDSIGVIAGQKYLSDHEWLVPIAIRGGGYESEWASNVTLGTGTGEAKGFESAATQVMTFIDQYLEEVELTGVNNVKFWIVGFSRSAAVANIVSKRLVDRNPHNEYKVYSYCFEPPQAAFNYDPQYTRPYNSIFNIMNASDIVPRVAPVTMGFSRYGRTVSIPDSTVGTTSYDKRKLNMLAQLGAVNQNVMFGDNFEEATINYIDGAIGLKNFTSATGNKVLFSSFIDDFFDKFVKWTVENRYNYSTQTWGNSITIEQALSNVAPLPFTIPAERKAEIMKAASGIMGRMYKTEMYWLYRYMVRWVDCPKTVGDNERKYITDMLCTLVLRNTQEEIDNNKTNPSKYPLPDNIGNHLTAQEYRDVETALPTIIDFLFTFLSRDYWKTDQHYVGSLVHNMDILLQPHYPEIVLAWLRTYDSFYDNDNSHKPAEEIKHTAPDAPTSNLEQKTYYTNQTVKLSCTDPNASIFYTTDGTDPKTSTTRQVYPRGRGETGISLSADRGLVQKHEIKAVSRSNNLFSKEACYKYTLSQELYKVRLLGYEGERIMEYAGGEKVILAAPTYDDKVFRNWWIKNSHGDYITEDLLGAENVNSSPARFDMPATDLRIGTTYNSKTDQVEIELASPTDPALKNKAEWRYREQDASGRFVYHGSIGWDDPNRPVKSKDGVPVAVNWSKINGAYVAEVTLLPNAVTKSGAFAKQVKVIANETMDTTTKCNSDGSITATVTFRPKTTTVPDACSPVTVLQGTTAASLPLPASILIDTTFGKMMVGVTWDTSAYKGEAEVGTWTLSGALNFADANIEDVSGGKVKASITVTAQAAAVASPPTASVAAGVYEKAQSVTLASADPLAAIYYTTDGVDPTKDSALLYTPGTLIDALGGAEGSSTVTTIKAIAVLPPDGINPETTSDIAVFEYVINIPRELYKVTVECFDTNPLVAEAQQSEARYYLSGDTVYLTAPAGTSLDYVEWAPDKCDEGQAKEAILKDPIQRTVSFTMENKNVNLTANYISAMNEINVQMDAPVAGEDLPMGAKEYTVLTDFVKYTVPSENVAVAWNESGGKAEYNKEYSAMITIPAKVDGKYAFVLAKDEPVTVNVNGTTIPKENLSFDSTTGNISILHKFEKTAKSKLLSILPPMPSGLLPNGTAFEDIGMPPTVLIDVEGQSMQRAPVTWKMAPNEVYDPADPKAQSFLMHGSVTIPEDIDVNGVSTDEVP